MIHPQTSERSAEVRSERAKLKRQLAAGHRSPVRVLTHPPACAETATLWEILRAVPRMGKGNVLLLCRRARIDSNTPLGALTAPQAHRVVMQLRRAPGWKGAR